MMDEGIVEAAQTIRALEDGDEEDFYPIEPGYQEEEEERPAKRSKAGATGSGNGGGNGPAPGAGVGGASTGLLSEEAMENLKFYADMARQQAEERRRKVPVSIATGPNKTQPTSTAKPGGLAGLGGYDSDSD